MTPTVMTVDHRPGVIFEKVQADSGITYLAVDPAAAVKPDGLLVRHGSPETGQCGYYPLSLLLRDESVRQKKAEALGKRPPTANWVHRTRQALMDAGVACMIKH